MTVRWLYWNNIYIMGDLVEKTSPGANDLLVLEDVAGENEKKKITIDSLSTTIGNLLDVNDLLDLGDLASDVNNLIDHGELLGLDDDDHNQYALLAGRTGGQTLIGGTGSGENLTLQSTSDGTKGAIQTSDSVQVFDSGGDGRYWRELHFSPSAIAPGASGATLSVGGHSSAILYYLLDATNEYLYFNGDIHDDWDEDSDIVICILVALDINESDKETIDAELISEYCAEGDNMDDTKIQTRTIMHDIDVDNNAGDVHELIFVLDHDLLSHEIEIGDNMFFRFRLWSVQGVTAVRVLNAHMLYRTKYPREEIGTFPTEG